MRESLIERTACRKARELGLLVWKLAAPGQKGQPDRMFLSNGKAAFIEFKRPGGRVTALQQKVLRELREDGFDAEVFDNVAGAVTWLKEVFGV